VQVFRLRDGYANAARLGLHRGTGEIFDKKSSGIRPRFSMDLAVEQFTAAMDKQVDGQGAPFVLIAGVDHQIPQPQVPAIMKRCTTAGRAFRFAGWDDVAAALRARTGAWYEYEGEFHGTGASSILGGTVSTRVYLKQANAHAERALVHVAEPADAVARLLGRDDPVYGVLTVAWKRLLKVHPHDDITGCSVDTVHRENEMHITRAIQAADAVRRRMAEHLIEHFGGQEPGDERYAFFAMGTRGREAVTPVTVKADFEGRLNWGDSRPGATYSVVDDNGDPVPFRELARARSLEHPHPVVMLRLYPRLKPFAFQRFYLQECSRWPAKRTGGTLENERLRVKVRANGSIDVFDKRTRRAWNGLGLFSDQADCGDEYTFSHIKGDAEVVFEGVRMKRTGAFGCNGLQVAGYAGVLHVPAESSPKGRSKQVASLPVELEYSLAPGLPQVECRIRFTNTACDHRLRWNLSLPSTPRDSRAGLKFSEVVRPAGKRTKTERGFVIDPEHPADLYVAVERGRAGLAVYPRFPLNYEVVRGKRPRLSLTVLRAVGYLSRSDMLTRGGGAGPDTLTPEAQCLRSFDMCFAIRPFDTAEEGCGLLAEAAAWRAEPVTGLIMGYHPDIQPVPQGPLVEVKGDTVTVSSFKRTHDGRRLALRLFNAGARKTTAMVRIAGVSEVDRTLLNESELVERLKAGRGGWLRVPMARYSLCTLVFG
ncbi:MAG: hypothetical protein GF331_23560, partial [Chitinivibrionales bacterium]|nr:hypothetical protein [Chitinivibrionales bacterium]